MPSVQPVTQFALSVGLLFAACKSTPVKSKDDTSSVATATVATVIDDHRVGTLRVAQKLAIHFLDVGQGDCTLIQCPKGGSILVDCGSSSKLGAEKVMSIKNYISSRAGDNLEAIVISHPDSDHYNLLPLVAEGIRVDRLVVTSKPSEYLGKRFTAAGGDGSSVRSWIEGFDEGRLTTLGEKFADPQDQPNSALDCGKADIFVLAANVGSKKNARSIVLLVRYDEFDAIITGDATKKTEDAILNKFEKAWLEVEVLRVGHHGSRATSTDVDWVEAVSPEVAVFSAGKNNTYGHPATEVVNRLTPKTLETAKEHSVAMCDGKSNWEFLKTKEEIYVTISSGNIVVDSSGKDYAVTTEK